MRKLSRLIIIVLLSFLGAKIVHSLLQLSLGGESLHTDLAKLGHDTSMLIFYGVIILGTKRMLFLVASGLGALLVSGLYFVVILWLQIYIYGPILGELNAGIVSLTLVLLPIVVVEIKQRFC